MIPLPDQLAVIMARGESLRMGHSKGLCQLNDEDDFFVSRIASLYLELGIACLLVVRPEDEKSYGEVVNRDVVSILSSAGGGDTARTMKLALDWAASRGEPPRWFWAHPVDLPLVSSQTINILSAAANENFPAALRPFFDGTPGHPVLFPAPQLTSVLEKYQADDSMAKVWNKATNLGIAKPMIMLAVNDPGVIADFDTPDHLTSFRESKES